MTRPGARACVGATSAAASLLLAGMFLPTSAAAQTVPTDPANSGACSMSPATVAAMFTSGMVALNGVVKAADSTQVLAPNCGFFDWSEQMFLWMTSPAPATYGGGGRIMFSCKFFTVTPEDGAMPPRRTFLGHPCGRRTGPIPPIRMQLRKTELGPHGLPSLLSRSGHVIEVERTPPGRPQPPPVVKLENGRSVTVARAQRAPDGTLRLFDARGAEVKPARLNLPTIVRPRVEVQPGRTARLVPAAAFKSAIMARKFMINGIPIFVDLSGNVIDVEPNQADDGVLISQNGSLIYYITVVNDLFAYHRTMQGAAVIPVSTMLTFPMNMTDANAVKTFATGKGHTISEPQALAVESKSSWIEASAVANPNDYIQTTAVVPTFDKTNPNKWVPNGQKTVKLVMVGMHVVGSTNGHGEMVWATFEHLGNAPDAPYSYNPSGGGSGSGPPAGGGPWLFTPGGAMPPFNNANASWNGSAITGSPVGPSVIERTKPWGTDGSNAGLNTEVIAANASVISQLKPLGDVRANYFQVGTTWTIGGAPPSGGNEVGTNQLANATIESFMQAKTPGGVGANCFGCHLNNTVAVSHIYRELKPLP
jgi:hypothetical protein